MKTRFIIALAAMLLPVLTFAQFTLSGKVYDQKGDPIPGTSISLKDPGISAVADNSGRFELKFSAPGTYSVTASFIGYHTVVKKVSLSGNASVFFTLSQATLSADEILVSATRVKGNAATTYKNISKEMLERNNFGQDLPFLLDNTPGVVVTSDAGAGIGYTGIRIRGSDATRVNVTLNGIPYNDSESQGTFWVNMPDFASSVENIQIQRGVGSSTNGAGAFGGSVNIQTSGAAEMPFAELNNSAGSFSSIKNTLKFGSGLIGNKFSFEGRLSRIKSDGFIDRARSDLKSFFVTGAYKGDGSLLRVNVFGGSERTYQAWNGIPESKLRGDEAGMQDYISRNGLNPADADNLLQAGNRTYNSFTYKDQTDNYWQNHYQLLYGTELGEDLTFNGALHYTAGSGYYEEWKADQKLISYGLSPVVIGASTISRTDLVRRRWLDNDFYGLTYGFTYKPDNRLDIVIGGAYNRYSGAHFGQVIYARFGSDGNNSRHYYDNTGEKNDFNIFGKITLSPVEQLTLFADLQYRMVSYMVEGTEKNLNNLTLSDNSRFFNPKIGLSYSFEKIHGVYASYSVTSKEPNRDDYVNADPAMMVKPERLRDLEIGYRYNALGIKLGLNVYGMFYKDQLVVTGKINDVGEYFRQNVGESYRIGAEMDAALSLTPSLAINLNAALSRNKIKNFSEFIDDYDNGGQIENVFKKPDISFSPAVIVGGEIVFSPFKVFSLALQSKYVGKQFLDNTQNESRKINSYLVTNARLGYNISLRGVKKVSLGLLINNLLDKRYESNGYTFGYFSGGALTTENFYFPQAGTNFLFSVNVSF